MNCKENNTMNIEPEKNDNNMEILGDNEASKVTGGLFPDLFGWLVGKSDDDEKVDPTDQIMISPDVDDPGNENVFK